MTRRLSDGEYDLWREKQEELRCLWEDHVRETFEKHFKAEAERLNLNAELDKEFITVKTPSGTRRFVEIDRESVNTGNSVTVEFIFADETQELDDGFSVKCTISAILGVDEEEGFPINKGEEVEIDLSGLVERLKC